MSDPRRVTVVVLAMAAVLAGGAGAMAANTPPHLTGSGDGTWQVLPSNPDTGTQRNLHGSGHFTIGNAKVRGSVTSPGFIANGDCSVSVLLKTATGSIGVVGHSKRTSSSYPTCIGPFRFAFHTVKASGDLAGDSFKGVGHLDLTDHSAKTTDHGTFTLKLSKLTT